jgi:PPK2 family polyphosphate:nucleotide phosphotransferase
MVYENLMVKPGKKITLRRIDPGYTNGYRSKQTADEELPLYLEKLLNLQYLLYADKHYAFLVILQGVDAAGKDGVFRHVITALNPQGTKVWSFEKPSVEELSHDYLWRVHQRLPNHGYIGVFNRSHYEDVLVVRVKNLVPKEMWKQRYDQINDFERYLSENNIRILKLFLYISKQEQEKRLLARLLEPHKNWKFSIDDLIERQYWDKYMIAYEDMLNKTSTTYAPWYVIPADNKWFRNIAVAKIMVDALEKLKLNWPNPAPEVQKYVTIAKKIGKLPPIPD